MVRNNAFPSARGFQSQPDTNMLKLQFNAGNLMTEVYGKKHDGSHVAVDVDPSTGRLLVNAADFKEFKLRIKIKEVWENGDNDIFVLRAYDMQELEGGKNTREKRVFDTVKTVQGSETQDKEFLWYDRYCKIVNGPNGLEHDRNAGYLKFLAYSTAGEVVDMTISIVGQNDLFFVMLYEGTRVQAFNRDGEFSIPALEAEYLKKLGKDLTKYHQSLHEAATEEFRRFGATPAEFPALPNDWTFPDLPKQSDTAEKMEVVIESGSPRTKCWYGRNARGLLVQIHYSAVEVKPLQPVCLTLGQLVSVTKWTSVDHSKVKTSAHLHAVAAASLLA